MLKNSAKQKKYIGVFDSGLGGLTVLRHILKTLPQYNYIYLGDNGRVPYGNKSQALIYEYTKEAVDFLYNKGCRLIIVACNTASAQALRRIQQEYLPKKYPRLKVLGVIRPLAEAAAKHKDFKRIGVIGTSATINSKSYIKEMKHLKPGLQIYQQAAPLLVPLIEEGWTHKAETFSILKKYLQNLKNKKIEMLILACTHYPILIKEVHQIMGEQCFIPNTGTIVAKSLKQYLQRHPELNLDKNKKASRLFYTSDDPKKFFTLGKKFLPRGIKTVEKISW